MQVLHSKECLSEVVANFRFGQGFSSLVEFHERSSPTQLQDNIHVVLVLKEAMKTNYVGVIQGPVDINLHSHLCVKRGRQRVKMAVDFVWHGNKI